MPGREITGGGVVTVIAVTGATGFVGRHLCAEASRTGVETRNLPRELLREARLSDSIRGVDAVVHLAARAHRQRDDVGDPEAAFRADNVELTRFVAQACKAARVPRLIFVSSAGVLGRSSPPEGFCDTSPPAPHDAYTRSKLAAEELLRDRFAHDLQIAIIRPPLVYGTGATGNFARLLQAATSGWPLPVGAMNAPRSFISVRNLCDLLLQVACAPDVGGLCLLAADAEITSVANFVRSIAVAAGRKPRIVRVPLRAVGVALRLANRQGEMSSLTMPFVVHCAAASSPLRWEPRFRLEDEIRWTVASTSMGGRTWLH